MNTVCFSLVTIFSLLTVSIARAEISTKNIATEMSIMTRTMDLLMARQEMKSSIAGQALNFSYKAASQDLNRNDIDSKVKALTDSQGLESCAISFNETQSQDGSSTSSKISYKGEGCPYALSAAIDAQVVKGDINADVKIEIEIISPKLRAEFDLEKINMQIKIKTSVQPTEQGFALQINYGVAGKMISQKLGLIEYVGDIQTQFILSQTFLVKNDSLENYTSGEQKIKFTQSSELSESGAKESFMINDVAVNKVEFENRHASIALPGFETQPKPLSTPEVCEVKTYDATAYDLETIRKHIRENTIDSVRFLERSAPISLNETGKVKSQIAIAGQNLEIESSVSEDAARFVIQKIDQANNKTEVFGRMTAVLGEKTDLTKLILNHVVRITCTP